jgi:DNA-binding GntR family transcriptional regulator
MAGTMEASSREGGRTNRAYDYVLEKLTSGAYQPGQRCSIPEIATALGISRQPVMAAMQQLSNEDLIQIIPQVGCVAAVFTQQEWLDYRRYFASGEALITQIATEKATDEEIKGLRPLSQSMKQLLTSRIPAADKPREYRIRNQRFHKHIHKMARSPILDRQLVSLWNLTDYYITTYGHSHAFTTRVPIAIDEHDLICAAIEARNAKLARELMENHILEQFEGGAH